MLPKVSHFLNRASTPRDMLSEPAICLPQIPPTVIYLLREETIQIQECNLPMGNIRSQLDRKARHIQQPKARNRAGAEATFMRWLLDSVGYSKSMLTFITRQVQRTFGYVNSASTRASSVSHPWP